MKLASSSAERDLYESLAEIYSIIVTLDGLEKAYIKDVVTEAEYTETCSRLLKQYKSSLGDDTVAREFVDLDTFRQTWGVCFHHWLDFRFLILMTYLSNSLNVPAPPSGFVSDSPRRSSRHRTLDRRLINLRGQQALLLEHLVV